MFSLFLLSVPVTLAALVLGAVIANMVVLYREARAGVHHS